MTCPVIDNSNPQMHLSTTNNTYNTTVVFWCDLGYEFYDGTTARSIKCLETGFWSATPPDCGGVMCPEIPLPSYSTRNALNRGDVTS